VPRLAHIELAVLIGVAVVEAVVIGVDRRDAAGDGELERLAGILDAVPVRVADIEEREGLGAVLTAVLVGVTERPEAPCLVGS
jgi:hypothetical protein